MRELVSWPEGSPRSSSSSFNLSAIPVCSSSSIFSGSTGSRTTRSATPGRGFWPEGEDGSRSIGGNEEKEEVEEEEQGSRSAS